ncbi:MAG: hypothetical protein OEY34_08200, partial [Cyclobacteriaceae bacterium]|nr:hypothetical protein [Cyclobacteriaceae bacterium]
NKMKGYFIQNNSETYFKSEVFGTIIKQIQKSPQRFDLKEHKSKPILEIKNISNLYEGLIVLNQLSMDNNASEISISSK